MINQNKILLLTVTLTINLASCMDMEWLNIAPFNTRKKMLTEFARDNKVQEGTSSSLLDLMIAITNKDEHQIKLLIKKGVNVNDKDGYGRTPLISAARCHEDKNIILILLNAGADINATNNHGQTALDLIHDTEFKKFLEENYKNKK